MEYLTSDEGTDDLVSILTFHVLGDVVAAGAIPDGETKIPSLESSEVTITKTTDGVTVESANVVGTDVLANNGKCFSQFSVVLTRYHPLDGSFHHFSCTCQVSSISSMLSSSHPALLSQILPRMNLRPV